MKKFSLGMLVGVLALTPAFLPAFVPSTKALGMALASVAFPQESETGSINPATMVWVGNRGDFGFTASHNWARTTISGNVSSLRNGDFNAAEKRFFYDFHGGFNRNFCCDRFSFGFTTFNNSLVYSKYNQPIRIFGTSNFRASVWQEFFNPMVSFKIHKCHSIGVAMNFVYQAMDASGIENFANTLLSIAPTYLTNKGKDWSHGFGTTIGYLGHINKYVTIGATYQPKIHMSQFKKYKGFLADAGRLNIPSTFALGLTLHPLSCLDVAFDYRRINYSNIRSLHNPLLPNLALAAGGNAAYRFGTRNAPGFGWHDKESYHLGVSYTFNPCFTWRAGYGHTNTWWGRGQTTTNLAGPETVENFVTTGFTAKTWCNTDLSMFYIHGFFHKVKGQNSISALSGGGETDLAQRRNVFGVGIGKNF